MIHFDDANAVSHPVSQSSVSSHNKHCIRGAGGPAVSRLIYQALGDWKRINWGETKKKRRDSVWHMFHSNCSNEKIFRLAAIREAPEPRKTSSLKRNKLRCKRCCRISEGSGFYKQLVVISGGERRKMILSTTLCQHLSRLSSLVALLASSRRKKRKRNLSPHFWIRELSSNS